jgi:DNA-binding winged helix-turn-helix (wHTH) protein/Tol biopolymer transport system component
VGTRGNAGLERAAKIRFGGFELDPGSGALRKHGSKVRLPSQPFQLLRALLARNGEIVSREELRQLLWSDGTFVDFEHGLNAAVNKLRQVLGDSADSPRFIETLPGRGYRFIAPIETIAETKFEPDPDLSAVTAPAAPPHRFPIWAWMGLALLGGLLIGLAVHSRRDSNLNRAAMIQFSVPPPAGYAFMPSDARQTFSLSPDGRRLAFATVGNDGVYEAWLQDFESVEPVELPDTQGAHTLFWTGGRSALFLTVRRSVRRLSADGRSFQLVCDLPEAPFSGTWLPPGQILLSTRSTSYSVPVTGGELKTRSGPTLTWPQSLPDGEHFISIRGDAASGRNEVLLTDWSAGGNAAPEVLFQSDSRVEFMTSSVDPERGWLVYVRAGNLMAQALDLKALKLAGEPIPVATPVPFFQPSGAADFSAAAGHIAYRTLPKRSAVTLLTRDGKTVGTVGQIDAALKYARLSPDGRLVAAPIFNSERGTTEIWLFNTSDGQGRLFAGGPGLVDAPVWSPRSDELVYIRAYGAPPKLARRAVRGLSREEPLPAEPFQVPVDWSADGRFILFANTGSQGVPMDTDGNVSLMDLANHGRITPLLNSPFHEFRAAFSPDGRWVAFLSNDSGRPELYVQAFDSGSSPPRVTGDRRLVSREGALFLVWRRDGKEIEYLGSDGVIHAVPVTLGKSLQLGTSAALFAVPLAARTATATTFGFDVSADGSRFIVPTAPAAALAPIVVIRNWEQGLKTAQ